MGDETLLCARRTYLKACTCFFVLLIPTLFFLNNEPVWDDPTIFAVHAHWTWQALFGAFGLNYPSSYWRPLTVISIVVPYLIGLPIWVGKLVNVTLFFVQGCLALAVTQLVHRRTQTPMRLVPLLALAALLALHPIFVETTLWIAARADLLLGVFVMLGIYRILRESVREREQAAPESQLGALVRSIAIAWLMCASKDTGIVWAGLALLLALMLSLKSVGSWKKYWLTWCVGLFLAMLSYSAIRIVVLHNSTGYAQLLVRPEISFTDRLRVLAEFIARSLIDFFIPLLDLAPFKSAGWLVSFSTTALIGLLVFLFCLTGFALRWLFRKNSLSGSLCTAALILVLFHACLTAFAETTQDSILAARYLAPGAILMLVALCVILVKRPGSAQSETRNLTRIVNLPVAFIVVAMLLQSILCWNEARSAWSTNLGLWESSWAHGSRSKIAAVDYANAELFAGNLKLARAVALDWIEAHRSKEPKLQFCKFYNIAIKASLALKDQPAALQLAGDAAEVAWCLPDLMQNVAFLMMESHCQTVLPSLERALIEAQKPEGVGRWRFDDARSKENFLLMSAYGQARCGSEAKARGILAEATKLNPTWDVDGQAAQGLLKSARH